MIRSQCVVSAVSATCQERAAWRMEGGIKEEDEREVYKKNLMIGGGDKILRRKLESGNKRKFVKREE